MAWQLSEPPKADPESFAAKDWLFQLWKFLKFGSNTITVSADYNARMEDKYIFVNAASGNKSITLPLATGNNGKEIIIVKVEGSGNSVTGFPRGTETINGSASVSTTTRLAPIRVVSDNSGWILW